jgi:hypothetical protein
VEPDPKRPGTPAKETLPCAYFCSGWPQIRATFHSFPTACLPSKQLSPPQQLLRTPEQNETRFSQANPNLFSDKRKPTSQTKPNFDLDKQKPSSQTNRNPLLGKPETLYSDKPEPSPRANRTLSSRKAKPSSQTNRNHLLRGPKTETETETRNRNPDKSKPQNPNRNPDKPKDLFSGIRLWRVTRSKDTETNIKRTCLHLSPLSHRPFSKSKHTLSPPSVRCLLFGCSCHRQYWPSGSPLLSTEPGTGGLGFWAG